MLKRSQPKWLSLYDKARKRALKLDKGELLDWADTVGSSLARDTASYRRDRNINYLASMQEQVHALAAIVDELYARNI